MIIQLKDLEIAMVKTHLPIILTARYIIDIWLRLFPQIGLNLLINLLNCKLNQLMFLIGFPLEK